MSKLRSLVLAASVSALAACGDKAAETPVPPAGDSPVPAAAIVATAVTPATAATVPAGSLKAMPWLLGTFRGAGTEGTTQDAFYERYSLANDSTLIVEGFKDSTLAGAIDTTRYELRRDSLASVGQARYVATAISPDSVAFGPLVGVKNGFVWRKGDDSSWTAVIIPLANPSAPRRTYRMGRIR